MHGIEGYRLLMRLGYPREAYLSVFHILLGLTSQEAHQYGLPKRGPFIPKIFEEKLIAIADFLIEFDKATTLYSRFASLRGRNCDNEYFLVRVNDAEMMVFFDGHGLRSRMQTVIHKPNILKV